jgi:xanthine dehydrogenase accessory factor
MAEQNDACAVAHGDTAPAPRQTTPQPSDPGADRALIAVFASSVSGYLLRYAADAGYRCLLVDPDPARASGARMAGFTVADAMPENIDGADVVVTDHHRDELGVMLRDALAAKARWVGINIGSRTPPEIAISTLAGLLADRNSRPGGFSF